MYCSKCGAQNSSSASFCAKCGAPIGERVPARASRRSDSYDRYRAPQAGALSCAWSDITSTPGWFKKVLFLCLLSCIPILNFAIDGYSLRWGRELSFDKNNLLPKAVFKKKEILTGFRAFLLNIIYASIFFIVSYIVYSLLVSLCASLNTDFAFVMAIILIFLLVVAYVFAYWPIMNASIMRMTVVDYLESGLNVQKTWNAFRGSPGSAISATVVPAVISLLIQLMLWAICLAIIAALVKSTANGYYDMYSNSSYLSYLNNPLDLVDNVARSIYSLSFISTALYLVFFIITGMFAMFAKMITWRAIGYWAAWTAPEWALESDEEEAAEWMDKKNRDSRREEVSRSREDFRSPSENRTKTTDNGHRNVYANEVVSEQKPASKSSFRAVETDLDNPDDKTVVRSNKYANGIVLIRISTGATYKVTSFPSVIGKVDSADVVIENAKSISRKHAKLAVSDGALTVEDLESTNGTTVNGKPISAGDPVEIVEGDVISLSDESFRLVIL